MMSEAEAITEEQLEEMLPLPVGYRVLIALPQVKETFDDTDLVKSSQTLHEEHVMSIIGLVVDIGSQAYADKDRFPTGAWCKVGDTEYRLMNDDSIEAVVQNPYGISRA